MKYLKYLLFGFFIIIAFNLSAQNYYPYQYVSPKPGSELVSSETNIILRYSAFIDRTALSSILINIRGSISGNHTGELILSDDNKTIVFTPENVFVGNEEVIVVVEEGIRTLAGEKLPEYSFSFSTAPDGIVQIAYSIFNDDSSIDKLKYEELLKKNKGDGLLPAPTISIESVDNPSPGYIFMATWDRNIPAKYGNFIFVLDKNGVITDSIRVKGAPYDFQIQENGLLSYALGDFSSNVPLPGEELQHIVLDQDLVKVDSFKMKNGYNADFHEFKMLSNGHVMLMSYHTLTYDMSTLVEGGNPEASLVINIIQEQDREKNVVFEWRNIDYIPITDSDLDLTDARINYSTLNAFDIDNDGNILASFRNHSEVMKISRLTGKILWRMGSPRGEFSFVGEHIDNAPYYFSRQHNISRLSNGNISIFDNGQHHLPPYSRAVEYELDEINKVATLVKEWRYPAGNIFTVTAGNAQLLPDSGWFIGYGVPNQQFVKRNAVEVHKDGTIALELTLPDGVLAYRASKFPWRETVDKHKFVHYEVRVGNTYSYNNESISTGVEIEYSSLQAADYNESIIERLPYGPVVPQFVDNIITVYPVSIVYSGLAIDSHTSVFHFDLAAYPEIKDPENTIVYHRKYPGQGLFIPLVTGYDAGNNELLATLSDFGEIVFGVPENVEIVHIPILYEPLNKKVFLMENTITLRWTGKGMYNSFNLQISADSTFSTINDKTNTNNSDYTLTDLERDSKYFWRVNSVLGDNTSAWSEIWKFSIHDTTTSIIEILDNRTPGYNLNQNYPNPFNTFTTITYSVYKQGPVTLKVFNQVGMEVLTLVNAESAIGTYNINLDARSLPEGVYFYQLTGGDKFLDTKKMLLIKK